MNTINITASTKSELIPHIVHGASANTMFYFVNYGKLPKEYYGNDGTLSIPYDLDDFSRCVLAANAFKYTKEDIQNGMNAIRVTHAAPIFMFLFENFLKMKKEFEAGNTEVVKKFISKLQEIKSGG